MAAVAASNCIARSRHAREDPQLVPRGSPKAQGLWSSGRKSRQEEVVHIAVRGAGANLTEHAVVR